MNGAISDHKFSPRLLTLSATMTLSHARSENAKNLLMCKMGEVPYDRYRGFNPALFDLPMQQFEERLLPELDRVMLWEPDVEIVGATCDQDENGSIIITATIEIDIEE